MLAEGKYKETEQEKMLNKNTKNKAEMYHIKSSKGQKKRKLTA